MRTEVQHERGFTLVELAIVLILIGLLLGGIMTGISLISNSKTQAIITEVTQYRQLVAEFQQKYYGMPGDLTDAVTLFGAATANGNGNGQVDFANESYRAWQQLALAGMVPGNYTGTHTGNAAVVEVNVPLSRVEGAGYTLLYADGSAVWHSMRGNVLAFGAPVAASFTRGGALSSAEAREIDTKLDDGDPDSGDIRTRTDLTNCTTGTAPSATYVTASAHGRVCGVVFRF